MLLHLPLCLLLCGHQFYRELQIIWATKNALCNSTAISAQLLIVGLYWFDIDNIYWGLLFYFLALIGAWSSLVFYNSYLPDIAYPEQHNRISARGFPFGNVGSVLLLLVNLFMVLKPEWFGITGAGGTASLKAMRYSFVMVGVWWFHLVTLLLSPSSWI